MNIVIIEDEANIAWELRDSIERLKAGAVVQQVLDSVEAGKEWFNSNPMPDLVFSDIQLGDGSAFEIFTGLQLRCPVIFCTAFDQYAIEAFRHNAIDYLLKPVDETALEKSLHKIALLRQPFTPATHPAALANAIELITRQRPQYKQTLLVTHRDKMVPVPVSTIAYFQLRHDALYLYTTDSKGWLFTGSIDQLEKQLDPGCFYRANRQTLVAYSAIKEIEFYFDRKLLLHLSTRSHEPIIVSKARATEFIRWMEAH